MDSICRYHAVIKAPVCEDERGQRDKLTKTAPYKNQVKMKKTIVVLGATGNLGGRIVKVLLAKGAAIKAIVRAETDSEKINELVQNGVKVFCADINDKAAISAYFTGADCVVSALAGLRETIIDAQVCFLNAAVEANVKRFIPSDCSSDFTNLQEGQNRNLDLRREFHLYLDKAPLKATTIFNGPFMDLLTTDMPLILFKQKRILCWGTRTRR
jgi:NAD(P)-dependent dehydrogenase (short-subunit alcohol dehydrogenase family)